MFDQIKSWFQQPYSATMTGTNWFFFVGFLIIAVFLWSRILAHMFEAAKEI